MSSPSEVPEIVVLTAGPPADLRALQEVLRGSGFESHLVAPPAGSGKG